MRKGGSNLGILLWVITLILPTACGMEAIPLQSTIPNSTKAVSKTIAVTSTLTSTNTWIPSSTPTVGPPPDLELKDITVYPQAGNYEHVGQKYSLLGRTRNNTNKIMVFSDRSLVFKFTFEFWEYNSSSAKNYQHVIFTREAEQSRDYFQIVNCILYPGDEGVFMYDTYSSSKEYILYENFQIMMGRLGFGFPTRVSITRNRIYDWITIPKRKIWYIQLKKARLFLIYDVNLPKKEVNGYSRVVSYLILLDKEGEILNILSKDIIEMGGVKYGKPYHVHGTTATSVSDREKYFRPKLNMTQEMIDNFDHLDVLIEFQEKSTCR